MLDALTDAVLDFGRPPPAAFALPMGIRVVELDQWRQAIDSRGVIDKESKNPRQDFKRIREKLAVRELIGERDGLVWSAA